MKQENEKTNISGNGALEAIVTAFVGFVMIAICIKIVFF